MAPDPKTLRVRVELRWWTLPLLVAVTPFALLTALFDARRAMEGLVNTATLGVRVYGPSGRRLPNRWERRRAREELLRQL